MDNPSRIGPVTSFHNTLLKTVKNLQVHWRGIFIFLLTIFGFYVTFSVQRLSTRCLYMWIITFILLVTDVIPSAVTSTLPIMMLPLWGITSTDRACQLYFKDMYVMFSSYVSTVVQYSKLNKRICFRFINIFGCNARRLHAGLCVLTVSLSMWMSNAATVVLMIPFVDSVTHLLRERGLIDLYNPEDLNLPFELRRPSSEGACFFLSVSYAATIGGCSSFFGSPSNFIIKLFPNATDHLSFKKFAFFGFPFVIIFFLLLIIEMDYLFLGLYRQKRALRRYTSPGEAQIKFIQAKFKIAYETLGPITAHEISVILLFFVTICVYVLKEYGEIWSDRLISNTPPIVGFLILLNILPANYNFLRFRQEELYLQPTPPLLSMKFAVSKIPWDMILLVGCGTTLIEASHRTGMWNEIIRALIILEDLPLSLSVLILITICAFLTNFMRNITAMNFFIPVIAQLAILLKVHPLYLMMPTGLACGVAFMLPIGTPGNILIQQHANISRGQMMRAGLPLTITAILLLWFFALVWTPIVFPNVSTFPSWANYSVNRDEEPHSFGKGLLYLISRHYIGLLVLIPPILLSPILVISDDTADRCIYLLCIMCIYWITEVVPLGVTSLLPVIGFPFFEIMTTDLTCRLYFKDVNVMFVNSIMVACAIEYSNFHVRLALLVLKLVGCSPRKLHLGICLAVSFMSMWISNSACTAMMLPIVHAILKELDAQGLLPRYLADDSGLPEKERRASKISRCFFLSVCYSSSVGGLGTLIGTPTNLTFKGIYESRFPNSQEKIEFTNFMAYSLPITIVLELLLYLTMEVQLLGLFRPGSKDAMTLNIGKEGEAIGAQVIQKKYDDLGPITCHEISVALLFLLLIFLYIARSPGFMPGWTVLFDSPSIKNSCPTIFVLLLLFLLPANYKFLKFNSDNEEQYEKTPPLLTRRFLEEQTPWGLMFLVGGGAVLSTGSQVSGMADKLGGALTALDFLPHTILLLVMMMLATVMTNFSANVAICNILIPVLCEMAVKLHIHPLYLVLPVGVACSLAFMLPVGTGPNAMVQSYANISTKHMILAGAPVSLVLVVALWSLSQTWGVIVYSNLQEYPEWADEVPTMLRSYTQ